MRIVEAAEYGWTTDDLRGIIMREWKLSDWTARADLRALLAERAEFRAWTTNGVARIGTDRAHLAHDRREARKWNAGASLDRFT